MMYQEITALANILMDCGLHNSIEELTPEEITTIYDIIVHRGNREATPDCKKCGLEQHACTCEPPDRDEAAPGGE